ncbi:MAG TPA: tRNA lysidine(34) synthetase TilS, partial [Alphaproteobacteria bacterium]
PSNRDRRFLRTVARDAAAGAPDAAATASSFGRGRAHRDGEIAAVLAAAVAVYPEGWAALDGARLSAAPPDIGRRALAQTLMCVSGNPYPPRGERLERIYDAIAGGALGAGRTLAGCRILERRDVVLIARETAAIGPDIHIAGPGRYLWDHRFVLDVAAAETTAGLILRGLGSSGWSAVAAKDKSLRALPIPPVVRTTLPAIYDLEGVRQVPHLMYRRQGADPDSVRVVSAGFRPRHVLAGAGFAVSPRLRGQIGR